MNGSIRKTVFYIITAAFFIASLCFSVFRFTPSFARLWESLQDLGASIAYYFMFFLEKEHLVTVTVTKFPETMETLLPLTGEEFNRLCGIYIELLFDWDNLTAYVTAITDGLYVFSQVILMLIFPVLILVFLFILIYQENDTKHNQDSKPLKLAKAIWRYTGRPIVFYVKKYIIFLIARPWLWKGLALIWLVNLNIATIAIEALAFFFYFAVSLDFIALLVIVAKIVADFSVAAFFIPPWLWVIIGLKIFDDWRCEIGTRRTYAGIEKVIKFLEDHPGAKLITGRQRSKKTSLLVQLKIILECYIFRPKAREKFLTREKQFPSFPWVIYGKFIINARKKHRLYNWTGIREFFKFLKWAKANERRFTPAVRRQVMRHLRRRWGYNFENFCFDYEGEMLFDDELQLITIYDALEAHGKTYMLYTQPTPLDVSNFSIRSDYTIEDEGNLLEFKGDTIRKSTKQSMRDTKYGHRIKWDAFRLGKQFNPKNPEVNSIEYGIRCAMEYGKERLNQITKRASEKDKDYPNQDNDLLEMETKIHTHVATCDNFTFWDDLLDEQRAASLGAENRDLTTILYIKKSGAAKMYLPFFALDEALFYLATSIFDSIYLFLSKKKGSNTLLVHLLWKLYTPLFRHYTRYFNRYSYYPLEVIPTDGGDMETGAAEKIPLIAILAYRYRFTTDALGEFYYMKLRGATMGLNDIPQYKALRMSVPEMMEQESYMIKDMMRAFNGGSR